MAQLSIRLVLGILAAAAGSAGCTQPRAEAKANPPEGSFTTENIRRAQLDSFRINTPPVEELDGGKSSREELVQTLLTALEARDTSALRSMALSRAEFAWIYYPTTPQARPPYDLAPGLLWFMVTQHSGKGLGKALEAIGGKRLTYAGDSCDLKPSREGENTIYGPCLVRLVQTTGDTVEGRIFGPVIERHGRWKFVSYANKLD